MKKYKEEKGSITLFVLIALLFFVGLLTTSYVATSNAKKSQDEASKQVADIYGKDVNNMNEIYQKIADKLDTDSKPENVNAPDLTSNMTPVIWNGGSWIAVAEDDPEWYNYDKTENRWANVILDFERYPEGTDFGDGSEYDMYVWIPRFKYNHSDFNIKFVEGNEEDDTVHPAFSKDIADVLNNNEEKHLELNGFWMSKYRASDDSFVGSSPYVDVKYLTLSEYWDWVLYEMANGSLSGVLATVIEEGNKMYIQTNADYGALLYMTGYALGHTNLHLADPYIDIMEDEFSTTGNSYGIYSLGINADFQLVSAIYSTEIHPYNDANLSDNLSYIAGIADNINEDIIYSDDKTYRIFESSGFALGGWENIYGDTVVRAFDNSLFGAGAPIDTAGSYHQCIIRTK